MATYVKINNAKLKEICNDLLHRIKENRKKKDEIRQKEIEEHCAWVKKRWWRRLLQGKTDQEIISKGSRGPSFNWAWYLPYPGCNFFIKQEELALSVLGAIEVSAEPYLTVSIRDLDLLVG